MLCLAIVVYVYKSTFNNFFISLPFVFSIENSTILFMLVPVLWLHNKCAPDHFHRGFGTTLVNECKLNTNPKVDFELNK